MKRTALPLLALALAVPIVVFTGEVAAAEPAPPPGTAGSSPVEGGSQTPPEAAGSTPALTGYQQQVSGLFTEPAGTNARATMQCPAGTHVVGGGAVSSSTSLDMSLNTSIPAPDGQTWVVYVNNAGSTEESFRIWAECVQGVLDYSVVVGDSTAAPAGTQATAEATCPTGTVPFGGGGFTGSSSTAVGLNSSLPLPRGWRVKVNNASPEATTATVYVACGRRPAGYQQVAGTATTVKAFTQGSAVAACPPGTKVLGGGGGGRSGSTSTSVSLNSSGPSSARAWQVYENNDIRSTSRLTAFAVCGQVGAT